MLNFEHRTPKKLFEIGVSPPSRKVTVHNMKS